MDLQLCRSPPASVGERFAVGSDFPKTLRLVPTHWVDALALQGCLLVFAALLNSGPLRGTKQKNTEKANGEMMSLWNGPFWLHETPELLT